VYRLCIARPRRSVLVVWRVLCACVALLSCRVTGSARQQAGPSRLRGNRWRGRARLRSRRRPLPSAGCARAVHARARQQPPARLLPRRCSPAPALRAAVGCCACRGVLLFLPSAPSCSRCGGVLFVCLCNISTHFVQEPRCLSNACK
jgi:hypothetical protein